MTSRLRRWLRPPLAIRWEGDVLVIQAGPPLGRQGPPLLSTPPLGRAYDRPPSLKAW